MKLHSITGKHPVLVFLCIILTNLLLAQPGTALRLQGYTGQVPFSFNKNESQEQPSERSRYSSTYLTQDGRTILHFCKAPLNYKDKTGNWQQINPGLRAANNGWSAPAQDYPTSLFPDGSVSVTTSGGAFQFSRCRSINGREIKEGEGRIRVDNAKVIITDVLAGIDKEMEFLQNAIHYNYIIRTPQAVSAPFLDIVEDMRIPQGMKLKKDENHGFTEPDNWIGDLLLVSEKGEEEARLRKPYCYDASGAGIRASYQLKTENGKPVLTIRIPSAWLSDPLRTYPVTIDPLVSGPLALWSGGNTPSCVYPSYSPDTLQVTIPGKITVSGFYVSTNYYADPSSTAILKQGRLYFTTSCTASPVFAVQDTIAGNLPGYAYLTNYDLRTPLLCCYPQLCTPRTFTLVQHLARTTPSTGCNMNYIYYDAAASNPFSAYVEGHTVETYAGMWTGTPASICSNTSTVTGTVYVRYGVPPYHITHPWYTGSVTGGVASGCSTGAIARSMVLNIPGFPRVCDTISGLQIPPPLVIDACGDTVSGIPAAHVHVNEAPTVSAPPALACSGAPASIALSSCVTGSTYSWSGNSSTGTSSPIITTLVNTGSVADTIRFTVTASANGCTSVPLIIPVTVDPEPPVAFSFSPNPAIANTTVAFTDNTVLTAGTKISWAWSFGDNSSSALPNPVHVFAVPGTYTVCLALTTSHGCIDTTCKDMLVIPARIVAPNIITPNGDHINDELAFQYLEYFGSNNLKIYDRWGRQLLDQDNYANNWNGNGCSDGTYYYVLSTSDGKIYPGYVEVFRGK
ncbi:MAG: gliding motility-associated C-terminal domain-containing protein [Bacteroidia bacterium]